MSLKLATTGNRQLNTILQRHVLCIPRADRILDFLPDPVWPLILLLTCSCSHHQAPDVLHQHLEQRATLQKTVHPHNLGLVPIDQGKLTESSALYKSDKSFRRYALGVERTLALWDTAQQEWADYISFLGRLLNVNCPSIPCLPQCAYTVVYVGPASASFRGACHST